jgi:hypothetical protein
MSDWIFCRMNFKDMTILAMPLRKLRQALPKPPFLISGLGFAMPPPPDMPAAENLRRLASRFLCHPDSQIVLIRMEPGPDGRFRVVISLEMADFY